MITKSVLNIKKDIVFIDFNKRLVSNRKLVVTPNLPLISRELTTKSQIAIIINYLLKLGYQKIFSFIINNLPFFFRLIKKDFATGIKVLCELEVIHSKKKKYLLHSQVVDTAVALNNSNILKYFFYLSLKYNFDPGVITYNIGPFITFLSRFNNLPKNLIIYTPINKNNYLMNPSYLDVYRYLKKSEITFVPIKDE